MSLSMLSQEIEHFLATPDPEVLCIMGKWGVGKTYAWTERLKEAQSNKALALERYSYVSLFGQSSLEDLRQAIWENSVTGQVESSPSFETLEASLKTTRDGWRRLVGLAKLFPGASDYAGIGGRALFLMVRQQIVCLDDLERAGESLRARDVLGLVSFLKEQRKCKIAILLNEEALAGENSEQFQRQLEKVADTIIRLDPTPEEAAEIGVSRNSPVSEKLKSDAIALGIVNIRTIHRIQRYCDRVIEIIGPQDQRIYDQCVQSLTLFSFSKHQPDLAPSLAVIRSFNSYEGLLDEKEGRDVPADHSLLRSYNFNGVDELDLVLLDGLISGSFDQNRLRQEVGKKSAFLMTQDKQDSFRSAWDIYHSSFNNDPDTIADLITTSLKENLQIVPPSGLDAAVKLLKDLGRREEALQLVAYYVDNRNEDSEFWDPENDLFHGPVDEDVVAAFLVKRNSYAEELDPVESLKNLGSREGWSRRDVDRASLLDPDDLYRIFKSLEGVELRRALNGALSSKRVINAGEAERKIVAAAEAALRKIASENKLNERVIRMKYGLSPTDQAEQAP